jgi:glycosyltransferase involved in cell wall biosynthesis
MASKSKINILYIADPNSIHNIKWMSYFAEKSAIYNIFLCCESREHPSDQLIEELTKQGIIFTKSLPSFSIRTPFKNRQSYRDFKLLTKTYSIDVVHVLFATPYALWLRNYQGHSVISTRGSDVLRVLPELKETTFLKGIYHRFLFRLFSRSFHNANTITSTSSLQVQAVKDLFGKESHLIRTGVNVAEITSASGHYPLETHQRFKLFSPRFMHPIYGINRQLEALSILSEQKLNQLHFLGIRGKQYDKHYFEEMKEKLTTLEKKGLKWDMLDYLSPPQMISSIKAADLVVMTPVSDGTPNTALEAMAAGVPLIVSDLQYDKELFDETCWKWTSGTTSGLAELINKGLEGHYPKGLLDNALYKVKRFGNRSMEMEKLERISYLNTVSGSNQTE